MKKYMIKWTKPTHSCWCDTLQESRAAAQDFARRCQAHGGTHSAEIYAVEVDVAARPVDVIAAARDLRELEREFYAEYETPEPVACNCGADLCG